MATANERLFDLSLRHQIDLRRFTVGEVKKILRLLEAIDADVAKRLRRDLVGLADGTPLSFTPDQEKRFRILMQDISAVREAAWKQVSEQMNQTTLDLVDTEVSAELAVLEDSIPVAVQLAGVEVATVRAAAVARPFQGRLLKDWFSSLQRVEQERLEQAIRLGLTQGENLDTIVRRVIGTKAKKYSDGILTISRRNAEAVVRTAINHVSQVAREEVWSANADIIIGLRWTSTLDGRTSSICRARDGKVTPLGTTELPSSMEKLTPLGARPPAHINCRSVMVPVLGGEELVTDRAFVTDTRTRRKQEIDFRAEAKEKLGASKWSKLTPSERNREISKVRSAWAKANIGQVPSTTTYQQWLASQPAAFQDDVLGKTKGALFRRGGLTLDQYVDRAGNELTIAQLRERFPGAFDKAGL